VVSTETLNLDYPKKYRGKPMGVFVHAFSYRCSIERITDHMKEFNRSVNEKLAKLQERGAVIKDIKVNISKDPPPYRLRTVTYVVIYESREPIEIEE